jgi:prepilin-type N-terminal cleavage/methylation domain-containing protein
MKIAEFPGKRVRGGSAGFSLIELMIVVAILGILAVAVGVHINSTNTRLKTFVFNTKALFNQARFEAIKRSRNVYLDFDIDHDTVINNGFTIWVDQKGDGDPYDPGDGDVIIETVVFPANGPEIYCATCASGGPGTDGPGTSDINDGVSVSGSVAFNLIRFKPDGDTSNATAYFYFPTGPAGAKVVAAGPWAIIVNSVGRIRVDEWRPTSGWQVNQT